MRSVLLLLLLPGKYVLLYSGDGKVTLDGDATVTAEAPGRLELNIKPATGAKRKRQTCSTCGISTGESSAQACDRAWNGLQHDSAASDPS
jgi:hypothetical protein